MSTNNKVEELSSTMLFLKSLKWMTSKEAAMYLRISVGELRNMVWRRQIHFFKLGTRLRFLRTDLDLACVARK